MNTIYYNNEGQTTDWETATYVSFQQVCTGEELEAVCEKLEKAATEFANTNAADAQHGHYSAQSMKLGANKYGVETKVFKYVNGLGITRKEALARVAA